MDYTESTLLIPIRYLNSYSLLGCLVLYWIFLANRNVFSYFYCSVIIDTTELININLNINRKFIVA